MTNQQQHPITPPPELVQQWAKNARLPNRLATEAQWQQRFARQAAQWGADQELEACCEWLSDPANTGIDIHGTAAVLYDLRAARRPEPPSLKEQALSELNLTADPNGAELSRTQVELIRRALEALPDD